jgi:hypothetical protein
MAYKAKPFLVNEHATYRFAELAKLPDTQLVMLVPKKVFVRLPEFIAAYEAVSLAGRFGADPGDYEWEWISNPPSLRWWRRALNGFESLFGWVAVIARGEFVELYGMVEVDENSPFWRDVIPDEAALELPERAKIAARQTGQPEEQVLQEVYRGWFKNASMLTILQPGQPAVRKGSIREVERFRDALKALLERSIKTALPSEVGKP